MNLARATRIYRRYKSTGSTKLFEDAAREEAQSSPPKSSQLQTLQNQLENWTGEERVQDTVLRMLMDKYKPLRTGSIRTAEQKLKSSPPKPATGSWATEQLIPPKEGHRPWHTEFKAPSHAASSIKLANIPPPRPHLSSGPDRQKKSEAKRTQLVGRLDRARDSTPDYRLGIRRSAAGNSASANPVSMKGWAGLVEDRIERARLSGLFKSVKGRGQPIRRVVEESNPFIGREEFLMNRIVQRNGAVPPWVQLQGELDAAVFTFREVLRQSWIRRALRNLTTSHPTSVLTRFTLQDLRNLQDAEWEKNEQSYHDAAVEELNSLVRKYNGIAPYTVRRPYYTRSAEVGRLYEDCAEEIYAKLAERNCAQSDQLSDEQRTESKELEMAVFPRFREMIKEWITEIKDLVVRSRESRR